MQLIDTHAHLDSINDIDAALERAHAAGVSAVVAVGENLEANKKNLELSRRITQPRIILALGIHPGRIMPERLEEEFAFIEQHIAEAKAIGEIGLDFWYKDVRKDAEKKAQQRLVYQRLLTLAREHHLPALIHTRGAWREALEMVQAAGVQKAVFHWYSGPVDVLEDILKAGYFISAAPSVAYSPESRRALAAAPVEQTLIETDSPVYYKQCDGGFQAEPEDVFRTLKHYAALKGRQEQELADILNKNTSKVFAVDL
jgi:TatD DNase family protein